MKKKQKFHSQKANEVEHKISRGQQNTFLFLSFLSCLNTHNLIYRIVSLFCMNFQWTFSIPFNLICAYVWVVSEWNSYFEELRRRARVFIIRISNLFPPFSVCPALKFCANLAKERYHSPIWFCYLSSTIYRKGKVKCLGWITRDKKMKFNNSGGGEHEIVNRKYI